MLKYNAARDVAMCKSSFNVVNLEQMKNKQKTQHICQGEMKEEEAEGEEEDDTR